MLRQSVHMLQITIPAVGAYLLLCLLTTPPRIPFNRITNFTSHPPQISEYARRPIYPGEENPLPLLPDFHNNWHERPNVGPGGGPFSHYFQSGDRVNFPITLATASIILTLTLLISILLRTLARHIPPPPAFEVQFPPITASKNDD